MPTGWPLRRVPRLCGRGVPGPAPGCRRWRRSSAGWAWACCSCSTRLCPGLAVPCQLCPTTAYPRPRGLPTFFYYQRGGRQAAFVGKLAREAGFGCRWGVSNVVCSFQVWIGLWPDFCPTVITPRWSWFFHQPSPRGGMMFPITPRIGNIVQVYIPHRVQFYWKARTTSGISFDAPSHLHCQFFCFSSQADRAPSPHLCSHGTHYIYDWRALSCPPCQP